MGVSHESKIDEIKQRLVELWQCRVKDGIFMFPRFIFARKLSVAVTSNFYEVNIRTQVTDRGDADAGAGLTLTHFVYEVTRASVVVTRLNRLGRVEIVSEQDADAFAPRVAASCVDDSVAMSARLLNRSLTAA